MKKIFEFWIPLLGPAFLFAFSCLISNRLYVEIAVFKIVIGSILFAAGQIIFYKLLKNKIPDIIMRTSIPLEYAAALSGCYISGIMSPAEVKFSLIFLGIVLMIGIMFTFRGIRQ